MIKSLLKKKSLFKEGGGHTPVGHIAELLFAKILDLKNVLVAFVSSSIKFSVDTSLI